MLVVCAAMVIVVIDTTMMTVAIPNWLNSSGSRNGCIWRIPKRSSVAPTSQTSVRSNSNRNGNDAYRRNGLISR